MEEPVHQTIKIGLLLSKLNQPMSKAEAMESCKIYFEIASSKEINNILVLELKQKEANEKTRKLLMLWLNRLALTKEAYFLIGTVNSNNKKQKQKSKQQKPEPYLFDSDFSIKSQNILCFAKNKQNPPFKISTRNINVSEGNENKANENKENNENNEKTKEESENFGLEDFAKLLAKCGFHKTDMHSPDFEFTILNASETFLGFKLWTNLNTFEERKAHLRPILHPTAINPKIARAMINLVGAKTEVFDPFCGIGGLLLEASLINLKSSGTDIDPLMIKRATLNLLDEQKIKLYEMDALKWNKSVECVVTDLPYGKSSKLDGSLTQLIYSFLTHYQDLTNKIAFCFPKNTTYTIPPSWKIKYEFEIYIHKSLTRTILILEKINS